MRWKSSRISASVYFGAFRSRLRSLWTQQRCTVALGQTNSDGASQPGVTVDDRQQRRPQPACDESSRHLSRRVLGHAVMQR